MRYRTPILIALLLALVIVGLWAAPPVQSAEVRQSWPDWRWWRWGTDKRYEVTEWLLATPEPGPGSWAPLLTPVPLTRTTWAPLLTPIVLTRTLEGSIWPGPDAE